MSKKSIGDKLVICELSDYAPVFYGNFMASLFDLEKKIKNKNSANKIIYAFYENSIHCDWAKEMIQNDKSVYFIKDQKLRGFRALGKILKHNNVNILHLHFNLPVIILVLMKLVFPKIGIIAHFHNTLSVVFTGPMHKLKWKIKVFLYNNLIDTFCGCSEAVFTDLIGSGLKKRKCCYIDNGIDFSRLDTACGDRKEIYDIKDKNVIMIYGTHFYRKGVDIAINAVKDIIETLNIVLMIVCQNREFVLEQIGKILGYIPEWIIVAPSQENISLYFRMCGIYLAPSREEGFNYAVLESIYCGTLTIRSNLSAMDRKIPNDIVVPTNDIPALRKSIEFVLKLDNKNKQIILAEQKEYIVQRWNIEIWSNKILDLYRASLKTFIFRGSPY